MALSQTHVAALVSLQECWPDVPVVLIGGNALALQFGQFWRTTRDLDLIVSVGTDELLGVLTTLGGWSAGRFEHEWISPDGARLDVLPAGPRLLKERAIVWSSGHRMSLVGMRHAFDLAVRLDLGHGLTMPVAPPHVLALLKMISFMDRPSDRERDLMDLAHLLEHYIDVDDDRMFGDNVLSEELQVREVSGYLLGLDVGRLVDESEAAIIGDFLERVGDTGPSHAIMLVNGPWRRDPDELLLRLGAFRRGFEKGRGALPRQPQL